MVNTFHLSPSFAKKNHHHNRSRTLEAIAGIVHKHRRHIRTIFLTSMIVIKYIFQIYFLKLRRKVFSSNLRSNWCLPLKQLTSKDLKLITLRPLLGVYSTHYFVTGNIKLILWLHHYFSNTHINFEVFARSHRQRNGHAITMGLPWWEGSSFICKESRRNRVFSLVSKYSRNKHLIKQKLGIYNLL